MQTSFITFLDLGLCYTTPHMNTDSLKSLIQGAVILPGDSQYDEMRQTFLGGIDKKPAVIVLVATSQDVSQVILFAQENNLPLAVRSGGHSSVGHCCVDDGVVIDLRNMNKVEIDELKQTAWVQAGATASQVTEQLDTKGFVLGFGDTGSVGVGGITVGGGIGFLVRKFGLTIDNLLAAEVVTADGNIVNTSEKENPDLFWAIRGGGGNFGIVTKFNFKLHSLPQAYGGMMMLPATPQVIAGCMNLALQAPHELSAIFNVMPAPPMPFLPAEQHGKMAVMALMMFAGDPAEGEKVMAPFRALATPLADMVKPMRYKEIFFPEDKSYHPLAISQTMFMHAVDETIAQTILDQLNKSDAAMRAVQLRPLGGAAAQIAVDATAYAHRSAQLMVNIATFYTGQEDRQKRADWVKDTAQALDQGEDGAYVNFLGDDGEERLHSAYPGKTWDRLLEIKKKYDPKNVFRLNQNITPR